MATDYYKQLFGTKAPGMKPMAAKQRQQVPDLADYLRNPDAHPEVARQADLARSGVLRRDPITGQTAPPPQYVAPRNTRRRRQIGQELERQLGRRPADEDIDRAYDAYELGVDMEHVLPAIRQMQARRDARERRQVREPTVWDRFVDGIIMQGAMRSGMYRAAEPSPRPEPVHLDAPYVEPPPQDDALIAEPLDPEDPAGYDTFAEWWDYISGAHARRMRDSMGETTPPRPFAPGESRLEPPNAPRPNYEPQLMMAFKGPRKREIRGGDPPALQFGDPAVLDHETFRELALGFDGWVEMQEAIERQQAALERRRRGEDTIADRFLDIIRRSTAPPGQKDDPVRISR